MNDRYELEARQLMHRLVAVEDIGIEAAVKLIAKALREAAAEAVSEMTVEALRGKIEEKA